MSGVNQSTFKDPSSFGLLVVGFALWLIGLSGLATVSGNVDEKRMVSHVEC